MMAAPALMLAAFGVASARTSQADAKAGANIVALAPLSGPFEIIGDELLVRGIGGVHRFAGAEQCRSIVSATFVHVQMKQALIDSRGGGKASVVYGRNPASVRTCEVIYKGLYTPPSIAQITPLEG